MKVTVAICTWNRSQLLDQTLTEMPKLRIPKGVEWELLVVNNNCNDDTDAVIAKHTPHLPLRRLLEPKQGQSHARNCAIDATRGELLVWTDDDVLVDPDWLAAYCDAVRRWPGAAYFGGRIDPWFESDPPAWITSNLDLFEGLLVIRNLDANERWFTGRETPFGANMAFRASALQGRRFDPLLGRKGNLFTLADETEFIHALARENGPGVWVPGARVRHFIPRERISHAYLRHYYFGGGITLARLNSDRTNPRFSGVPRWIYRRYLQCVANYWLSFFGTQRRRLIALMDMCRYRGMIHEYRHSNGSGGR